MKTVELGEELLIPQVKSLLLDPKIKAVVNHDVGNGDAVLLALDGFFISHAVGKAGWLVEEEEVVIVGSAIGNQIIRWGCPCSAAHDLHAIVHYYLPVTFSKSCVSFWKHSMQGCDQLLWEWAKGTHPVFVDEPATLVTAYPKQKVKN